MRRKAVMTSNWCSNREFARLTKRPHKAILTKTEVRSGGRTKPATVATLLRHRRPCRTIRESEFIQRRQEHFEGFLHNTTRPRRFVRNRPSKWAHWIRQYVVMYFGFNDINANSGELLNCPKTPMKIASRIIKTHVSNLILDCSAGNIHIKIQLLVSIL